MELKSILGYLQNKTILVTGATGFLAMGILPLLNFARKELFRVLKEKLGPDFDSFISEKVVAIPGDVTSENLGVKEFQLREEMCNEIQIILNFAATTNFDERYDVALDVNTFGVLNV
ncbi:hypothetical protein C1H46_002934 [Malus baccata]|uniref:Fatty acyl-CoA reductase n=1 Tax=Malus baccata TaxID=106549 RepID=A0A540NK31_MALBA|nr:hypothetical protein C1H46_002934 [Malus baccata]